MAQRRMLGVCEPKLRGAQFDRLLASGRGGERTEAGALMYFALEAGRNSHVTRLRLLSPLDAKFGTCRTGVTVRHL
jgi:hypothetical protein